MKNEPLLTVAFLIAFAAATIGLLTSFGLDLSADQEAAIGKFVAVAAPVVVGLVARRKVTPAP